MVDFGDLGRGNVEEGDALPPIERDLEISRHRDRLLDQLAVLVRERDHYRTRARKLEAQRSLAMDEAARMRRERDAALELASREQPSSSQLPSSDMRANTERKIRPIASKLPSEPHPVHGGYSLHRDRVPTEDVPRSRPCQLMLSEKA